MSRPTFEKIYADVPAKQRESLLKFRAMHPCKEFRINAVPWHYIACGQGSKTLLLLPGAFMKADMWFQTVLAFEKKYRIIIPDNYALQNTFVIQDVCYAHDAILDAEGVQKAVVIGVSGGAGVAQFFLQAYPHRVEHIVFSHCGVVKPENNPRLQRQIRLIRLLPNFIVKPVIGAVVRKHWEYPSGSEWVAFRNAYLHEAGQLLDKEIFCRFMEEGAKAHLGFKFDSKLVQNFHGEILLLFSRSDEWTAAQEKELRIRYPRAHSHIFEEGGHHTVLLFPEAYNHILEKFLDKAFLS
ncbi:MAG: alpha/beta hydrolase [Anaerolineales bacterium]|nr:alpha/beta hydrolase [Anaerolineales bacterium]